MANMDPKQKEQEPPRAHPAPKLPLVTKYYLVGTGIPTKGLGLWADRTIQVGNDVIKMPVGLVRATKLTGRANVAVVDLTTVSAHKQRPDLFPIETVVEKFLALPICRQKTDFKTDIVMNGDPVIIKNVNMVMTEEQFKSVIFDTEVALRKQAAELMQSAVAKDIELLGVRPTA